MAATLVFDIESVPDVAGYRTLLDLAAGYVQRSLADLPKQGSRAPWRIHQNYRKDVRLLARGPVEDEGVRFTRRARVTTEVAR